MLAEGWGCHKFTDTGEVVIKAAAGNGSFELSVRDTGPGISVVRPGQAVPGVSAGRESKDPQEGGHRTGARHIQAHHRDAWRANLDRSRSSDKGSTFFVTLPAQVQEQAKPSSN